MRVLALETATATVGAAVASEDGVLAEVTVASRRNHVELLHPAVEAVLGFARCSSSDLSAVAADVGPGLFTGIRAGVAAAKAMAMALALPAVGVSSLDALRHAAAAAGAAGKVFAVVDMRRGEVAWACGDRPRRGPPGLLAEELAAVPPEEDVLLVGDGAVHHATELGSARQGVRLAGPELSAPPVASVAMLAAEAVATGRTTGAAALQPVYLREADARINWTTRHDPAGRR